MSVYLRDLCGLLQQLAPRRCRPRSSARPMIGNRDVAVAAVESDGRHVTDAAGTIAPLSCAFADRRGSGHSTSGSRARMPRASARVRKSSRSGSLSASVERCRTFDPALQHRGNARPDAVQLRELPTSARSALASSGQRNAARAARFNARCRTPSASRASSASSSAIRRSSSTTRARTVTSPAQSQENCSATEGTAAPWHTRC